MRSLSATCLLLLLSLSLASPSFGRSSLLQPHHVQAYLDARPLLRKLEGIYGLRKEFVAAVIHAESAWQPKALSPKGAKGLMQIMPSTLAEFGITGDILYNPVQNIVGGTYFLKQMLQEFNGNTVLALAAYNAGPNAVKKYQGIPPYEETQAYVRRVLSLYKAYLELEGVQKTLVVANNQ